MSGSEPDEETTDSESEESNNQKEEIQEISKSPIAQRMLDHTHFIDDPKPKIPRFPLSILNREKVTDEEEDEFDSDSDKRQRVEDSDGFSEDEEGDLDDEEDDSRKTWISSFCKMKMNKYFCKIDEAFFQDDFNCVGIKKTKRFDLALDLILDVENQTLEALLDEEIEKEENLLKERNEKKKEKENEKKNNFEDTNKSQQKLEINEAKKKEKTKHLEVVISNDKNQFDKINEVIIAENLKNEEAAEKEELIENEAATVYGLFHARYIITNEGMKKMREKYKNKEFESCPRVACRGQQCLPTGLYDVYGKTSMKLYCPTCKKIYASKNSSSNKAGGLDGSYFGTTFAPLFFLNFPEEQKIVEEKENNSYVPKIFGFKIANKIDKIRPKLKIKESRSDISGGLADDEYSTDNS